MTPARADVALPMLAGELVRRVASLLAPHGIPVLLLKGALWQRTLYAAGEWRPIFDVDVIVPDGTFERARAILLAAGFEARPNPQGTHEQTLVSADLPIELDLHRLLFARGRYRLGTAELFARSIRDEALFGVPVDIPDARDQLAHLFGHLANDHKPATEINRADFERLVTRSELSPGAAAAHLVRHGLGRAARFALEELATAQTQAWAAQCRNALGDDLVGEVLASVARRAIARCATASPVSTLAGHVLNTSLPRVAVAGFWATLGRFRALRM